MQRPQCSPWHQAHPKAALALFLLQGQALTGQHCSPQLPSLPLQRDQTQRNWFLQPGPPFQTLLGLSSEGEATALYSGSAHQQHQGSCPRERGLSLTLR